MSIGLWWLRNQVQHVIDQLAMLLGEPATNAEGQAQMQPRRFTLVERGLVDQALTDQYAELVPNAPLDQMPILGDVIAALEVLGEVETDRLARCHAYLCHPPVL